MKIAVVQRPPVLLDKAASIAAAVDAIREAAAERARLIVFPEAFLPGYPAYIWRLRPGGDMALSSEFHARLRSNAVDLQGDDLAPISDAASSAGATIVLGLHERDTQHSQTTLYNTLVTIGPDGAMLNRHRKLVPTNPERMVWGMGDASGLRVIDTPAGRIGGLICWEAYMPLARYALYAQGMDIFINPTWDYGDSQLTLLRHIAKEGGCWTIGTATALHAADLPSDFPERDRLYAADEWINDGDAVVVHPSGKVIAGPLHREPGILFAEIDTEEAHRARRSLDVAGHYGRPDVFTLEVDRRTARPARFIDA
jgi:nitrilase